MRLVDHMDRRLVLIDLNAENIEDALQALVDTFVAAGILKTCDDAIQRLKEREQVMSTGIGGGIAIPHARTPEVDETIIALARSSQGVPFNAVDSEPVRVIFLILGPRESSAEHVKVLARIARLVKKSDFLSEFEAADTPEALLEAVVAHD